MKTLLIVEDEKMIRQGIAVMAKRCGVPIEEILECRNGVEALEILKSRPVDVMFTDIRMPKMDGIELVRHAGELEHKPFIVVVSGYDDFNYAVQMMKSGVRDYLLKPVKREKVCEILSMLDKEVKMARKNDEKEVQSLQSQLRYLFVNGQMRQVEWELLERRFREILKLEDVASYRVAVGNSLSLVSPSEGEWVMVEGVEQQTVFVMKEEETELFAESQPEGSSVGISAVFFSLRDLEEAYQQALEARKDAFIRCVSCVFWKEREEKGQGDGGLSEGFAQQFLQQFTTEKMEESLRKLKNLFFAAEHQEADASGLIQSAADIQRMLEESYTKLLPEDAGNAVICRAPLYYQNAREYLAHFEEWVRWMRCSLSEQFDSDQNRKRIEEAVRYIQENYQKDLNMAMVSNYVSMNYSLFSITFKEYTGQNFVNYLKNIRVTKAKQLLENTDEKILDISRKVGYENEKHFMKTFKSICGVSPSEYRKNMELMKGKDK